MEKKHIIKFLNAKKRGVYTLLVEMYSDVITSMATTMALEIIRADLEKDSEENVRINYYSLVQAVAKFKKKLRQNRNHESLNSKMLMSYVISKNLQARSH
jgi:hypothetical protein